MQTRITHKCVIKEETEKLGEKPLRYPPSGNWSTRQSVGIYGLAKDPPSLIYPLYLNPPSSYSDKASQNRVLSSSPDPATNSMLHLPSLASSNASQQHQKHSLHWEGVDYVWVQISSQGMIMGEGTRRDYNDFSLRMSSSLSKRWVCVVENLSRVFLSKWPPLHLWIVRGYI